MPKPKLKVMISSSVYGAQSLLVQACATLRAFRAYEVICSPVGTVFAHTQQSNLKSCLDAVEECDIFLGFIRPIYGSGLDSRAEKAITHLELEKAIQLKRPRWMLAHSSVVKMRRLVRGVFYDDKGVRNTAPFKPLYGEFDDLRVVEMYEQAADSNHTTAWSQRKNHWVHEYHYDFEALDFIKAQFYDHKRIAASLPPKPAKT